MEREFRFTAQINGRAVPFTIIFPDTSRPIHGGTWNARLAESRGEITTDEANLRVAAARLTRRLNAARQRQRHRSSQ